MRETHSPVSMAVVTPIFFFIPGFFDDLQQERIVRKTKPGKKISESDTGERDASTRVFFKLSSSLRMCFPLFAATRQLNFPFSPFPGEVVEKRRKKLLACVVMGKVLGRPRQNRSYRNGGSTNGLEIEFVWLRVVACAF